FNKVKISYVKKEKIVIAENKIKTHQLKLTFQNDIYGQPVFPTISKGEIDVWLTADQKQLPVKVVTGREIWINKNPE
ncbi:MAG: hypothetical protein R3345_13700, partial [Fulvivirga sp.]|nr:hypothetical protein [Fulvivirga sp.]